MPSRAEGQKGRAAEHQRYGTAGREPKVVAVNSLDAGCTASPAIAGKAIFIRTKKSLYRIEKK